MQEKKNIRVAQLVGHYGSGGTERAALNLALALNQIGQASFAISLRTQGDFAMDTQRELFHTLGIEKRGFIEKLVGLWRLRTLCATLQLDVIHVHTQGALFYASVALLFQLNTSIVFGWHDTTDEPKGTTVQRKILRYLLRRCAAITVPSSIMADRLAMTLPESSIKVLINGVPPIRIKHIPHSSVRLVWAGRWAPSKNVLAAIELTRRLIIEGYNVKLVLAGEVTDDRYAEYGKQILIAASDEVLEGCIHLPGWVQNTTSLVNEADIYIQTSLAEGLSMSLLEFMIGGVVAVATDVGDTRNAVINGFTGVLVPVNNCNALYTGILPLLTNKDIRKKLGTCGYEHVNKEYGFSAVARSAMSIYKSSHSSVNSRR